MKSIKLMVAGIGFMVLFLCGCILVYGAEPNYITYLAFISLLIGIVLFIGGLLIPLQGKEEAPRHEDVISEEEDNCE